MTTDRDRTSPDPCFTRAQARLGMLSGILLLADRATPDGRG